MEMSVFFGGERDANQVLFNVYDAGSGEQARIDGCIFGTLEIMRG